MPNNTLLEVKDLKMYFENKKGFLGKKNRVCKSSGRSFLQNSKGRNNRTCRRVRMWKIYNRIFDHASL